MNDQLQVEKMHYFTPEYNHRSRWMHYFYQIRLLQELGVQSVLEIGPGNGWVTRILKDFGFKVTTVDIDPALHPDVVASLVNLPIKNNTFEVVLAAEVLEHFPFEAFFDNVKKLSRVSSRYIIISLPDHRKTLLNVSLKLPFIKQWNILIKIPSLQKHIFDGQHYWEIGKKGYSVKRIKKEIVKSGLKIVKRFVPCDAPTNHYFVLEK